MMAQKHFKENFLSQRKDFAINWYFLFALLCSVTLPFFDHSIDTTGEAVSINPIGLYVSPTVKKNTVQSSLWEKKNNNII